MGRIRFFLKNLTANLTLKIEDGPLKGMRWGMFTGRRFIRGDYSKRVLPTFLQLLDEGDVVYDIGAHVGYYAVCAALRVGPNGKVVAFEPAPLNIKFLRNHLRVNNIQNVELVPYGVSDTDGSARFDALRGTGRGRLDDRGDTEIATVSLDALCASGKVPPPTVIKMDIEGAETKALKGARETLQKHQPTLFISLHGDDAKRDCVALLESAGYRVHWLGRSDVLAYVPAREPAYLPPPRVRKQAS